jgi:predicted transcriptional regulator of viral defense system
MLKTTEKLIEAGLAAKVFTPSDIKRVLIGTDASRYGLINKALDRGELIQLKRGAYILNPKYYPQKLSSSYIASQMMPHSYISQESALAHHGWIPEKVTVTSSAIHTGRSKTFLTPLGTFNYTFIPVQSHEFLTGVIREEAIDQQPFLIASGIRALTDYCYEKKIAWLGLDYFTDALRIDMQYLKQLSTQDFIDIKRVYSSKRVLYLLTQLEAALQNHE